MVGGWGAELKEVPYLVTELVSTHRAACEEKLGKTFATFTPVAYTHQVVAGVNHRIKARACETGAPRQLRGDGSLSALAAYAAAPFMLLVM